MYKHKDFLLKAHQSVNGHYNLVCSFENIFNKRMSKNIILKTTDNCSFLFNNLHENLLPKNTYISASLVKSDDSNYYIENSENGNFFSKPLELKHLFNDNLKFITTTDHQINKKSCFPSNNEVNINLGNHKKTIKP